MQEVPKPKIPFLKYYRMAKNDPIGLRTELFEKYGDIIRGKMKGVINYSVANPEYAQHILQDNQENYFPKNPLFIQIFEPVFGKNSIFMLDNISQWEKDRSTATISFEPKVYFDEYTQAILQEYNKLFSQWKIQYKEGEFFNIAHEIDMLTLNILLNTIFIKLQFDIKHLDESIIQCLHEIKHKLFSLPVLWYLSPARRAYQKIIQSTRKIALDEVIRRYHSSAKWDDSIGFFLQEYKHEKPEKVYEIIADQLITYAAATYFNLSSFLHWIVVVLSTHPEIEKNIVQELNQKISDRTPTYDDLKSLPYLSMVLKEVLRLYPPSFSIVRQAISADTIKGYYIPPKVGITISSYHINRHPDFWTNPQGFDPERFRNNPLGQNHPFAYLVFGQGMRKCPASTFSIMAASLFIIKLVRHFHLDLPPHEIVKPYATTIINMRPSANWMRLRLL